MFVGVTTFRSKEEARRVHRAVKRVHRRVHGIAPMGVRTRRRTRSRDLGPVTEAYSFLRASQLYGPRRFTQAESRPVLRGDVGGRHRVGCQLGTRSEADAEAYLRRIRPELYAGVQALTARDFLCVGSPNV